MYRQWAPYVSVATRRRMAAMELKKLEKSGERHAPVRVQGRIIAKSFWGKAWCDNLEQYCDFENRLPRGRTYLRNGSVLDLRVDSGEVLALVSGSSLYRVRIRITPLSPARWSAICGDCAEAIDSLVELLQGRFSKGVMERVSRQGTGLFPALSEIDLSCSCPDYADMCKHVAATLYGVGVRLDKQPQLLFKLRGVDERELVARASGGLTRTGGPAGGKVLDSEDLSDLFGLDFAEGVEPPLEAPTPRTPLRAQAAKAAPPPKIAKAAKAAPPKIAKAAKAAPPPKIAKAAKAAPPPAPPKPRPVSNEERAHRLAITQVEVRVAQLKRQSLTPDNGALIATFEAWLRSARDKLATF